MLGAKKTFKLFQHSSLGAGIAFLGLSSLAHASIPKTNAIYPLSCGTATTTRTHSAKYCLNKVGGTNLEVFSIETRKNSVVQSTEYYLVTSSYDVERRSSDGLAAVMTPAQRIKHLEAAETETRDEIVFLKSVDFTYLPQEFDSQGRSLDTRPNITLSEPNINVTKVRASNNGLKLNSGNNFDKPFEVDELKAVPQTRSL